MSLLDEIEATARRPGTACSIVSILDRLDGPDAADLRSALANVDTAAAAIGRVLRARGFALRDDVLTRHRRRECSCP